ncbi:MAG: hypothetical protein O8C55_11735 [Candidatus Methanoperedens sp.]|nr:hypothetical protein [Candidatus Methanoperedens sp.]
MSAENPPKSKFLIPCLEIELDSTSALQQLFSARLWICSRSTPGRSCLLRAGGKFMIMPVLAEEAVV